MKLKTVDEIITEAKLAVSDRLSVNAMSIEAALLEAQYNEEEDINNIIVKALTYPDGKYRYVDTVSIKIYHEGV